MSLNSNDPHSLCVVGVMTAVIATDADWTAFSHAILSVAQLNSKFSTVVLSVFFDNKELFPDGGVKLMETVLEGVAPSLTVSGDKECVIVVHQTEALSDCRQFGQALSRFPDWFGADAELLDRAHVMYVPHRGVWHPDRLTHFLYNIHIARSVASEPISCVCMRESTIDLLGATAMRIYDEDFGGVAGVDADVEAGLLRSATYESKDSKATWISRMVDVATPYRIASQFFSDPAHQWVIANNRFCGVYYAMWVRMYMRDGYQFSTLYCRVDTWTLYTARAPDDHECAYPLPGAAPMMNACHSVKTMEDVVFHAQLAVEMSEIPIFRKASVEIRRRQKNDLPSGHRERYTRACAEIMGKRIRDSGAPPLQLTYTQ